MTLSEYLATHKYRGPFKPGPRYVRSADQVQIWFEDAFALTTTEGGMDVHRCAETGRVVGVTLTGDSLRVLLRHPEEALAPWKQQDSWICLGITILILAGIAGLFLLKHLTG